MRTRSIKQPSLVSILLLAPLIAANLFGIILPKSAQAASPGELVRLASNPAVYYIAADGSRYSFPNTSTYLSWYPDFSNIRMVSQTELNMHALAGNVSYRPGSRFVKIQSDPKTYAVTSGGILRWIESEDVAMGLAGPTWNQRIDDVPDVFFTDYRVGPSLTSAESGFDGMLVNRGADTYLIDQGRVRLIAFGGFTFNRYQSRFVLNGPGVDFESFPPGSTITASEPFLSDTTQKTARPAATEPAEETDPATPPSPAALIDETIPPAMTIASNRTGVTVAAFRFTARLEPFRINKLTLLNCLSFIGTTCATPGADEAVASVTIRYVNEQGAIESKTGHFADGSVTFSNVNMYVPRDANRSVAVDIATAPVSANDAASGAQVRIALTTAGGNTFEAVGVHSTTSVTATTSNVQLCNSSSSSLCLGNIMTVRDSAPGLELANGSPTGPSVPGFNEVLRFNVGTGAGGFITLNQVLFKLNSTDNANSAWNKCGNGAGSEKLADPKKWTLYDLADPSTPIDDDEDWTFRNASGADCGTDASKLFYAELNLDSALGDTPAEEIAAGTIKTYVLRVDTSAASSSKDDTVRVDIPDEATANTIGLDALHWEDGDEDTSNIDGSLVGGLPITGGTLIY